MNFTVKIIYAILFTAIFGCSVNNLYSQVTVTATAGTLGPTNYASLNAALSQVGVVHNGDVTVMINATPVTLGATSTLGSTGFTSCTIYPTVAGCTLNYAGAASALLLNGSDNVIIDGRINGTGAQSLLLNCTATTSLVRGITMQNGAQNNIVRYVNITLPVTVSALNGGRCIDIAQSVAGTSGNDNITVDHCNLSGGDRTIQVFGTSGLFLNSNITITNNKVRNSSTIAIFIGSLVANVICDYNEIYDDVPVYKGGASVTSARSINVQATGNVSIRNNNVHDIMDNGIRTTNISIQGILTIPIKSAAPLPNPVTNVTVQNNIINLQANNIKVTSTFGLMITGVAPGSGLDYNAMVYNNTSLIGGAGTLTENNYACYFDVNNQGAGTSTATYYNNVGINLRTGASSSQHSGIEFVAEAGVSNTSDYNTGYSDGAVNTGTHYDFTDGMFGYNSTFSWRDAHCPDYEQHSAIHPVNYDANYLLTTNYGDMNGKPVAGVSTDYFGTSRDLLHPYRGAVEGPALKVLTVTASLEKRESAPKSQMNVALYDGCTIVDYATGYIDYGSSTEEYFFSNAIVNNTTAYRHQCLTATNEESWSSGTVLFTPDASYNFATASDIFGSNGTPDGKFYAADVNQDGVIDGSDMSLVENDALASVNRCRVATDINGDEIIDASDQAFVDINSSFGYSTVTPCTLSPSSATDKISMNLKNVKRVKLNSDKKANLLSGLVLQQ